MCGRCGGPKGPIAGRVKLVERFSMAECVVCTVQSQSSPCSQRYGPALGLGLAAAKQSKFGAFWGRFLDILWGYKGL